MFMDKLIENDGWGPLIVASDSERLQDRVAENLAVKLQEAVFSHPSLFGDAAEAVEVLSLFGRLPIERRRQMLLHPSFRYWLQGMRRTESLMASTQSYFPCALTSLLWSELCVAHLLPFRIRVMTDQFGGLRCLTRSRFVELGGSYRNQALSVELVDREARLCCANGLLVCVPTEDLKGDVAAPPPTIDENGYHINLFPVLADGRIEVSTRDPWLRVKLTGTNQRVNGTEFLGVSEDLYANNPSLDNLVAALELLKLYWPDALADMARFTKVIVPVKSDPSTYTAFTVSSRQGAIFIGGAPPPETVEMVLHENAHVKLRQIQALDQLLVDPLDETLRIQVPWRKDPRPIPGILEGVFVFTHVAEFEWRYLDAVGADAVRQRLIQRIRNLKYAIDRLDEFGHFTSGGHSFLDSMRTWVDDLRRRTTSFVGIN
jgi:HEXXH motif-containing protein